MAGRFVPFATLRTIVLLGDISLRELALVLTLCSEVAILLGPVL
jgi:hypothetical protein